MLITSLNRPSIKLRGVKFLKFGNAQHLVLYSLDMHHAGTAI